MMGKYPISDQGRQIINTCIAFMILPVIAVGLRFWSRAVLIDEKSSRRGRFWWDDWLILINLPFTLVQNGLTIYWVTLGFGLHVWEVATPDLVTGLKILYAGYSLYDVGISIAKLSVLCFYARVFSTHQGWYQKTLLTMGAIVIIWPTVFVITSINQCHPLKKSWLPWTPGHCDSTDGIYIASAISSVIIDFIILILPLPILWHLQLKFSHKVLITGVLLCGYVVIAISIGRLIVTLKFGGTLDKDITYNLPKIGYWWIVECPVEIISACLPSIFSLIKRGVEKGPKALIHRDTKLRSIDARAMGRSWYGMMSRSRIKPSVRSESDEELNYMGQSNYTAKVFNDDTIREVSRTRPEGNGAAANIRVHTDVKVSSTNGRY